MTLRRLPWPVTEPVTEAWKNDNRTIGNPDWYNILGIRLYPIRDIFIYIRYIYIYIWDISDNHKYYHISHIIPYVYMIY